MYELSLYGFIWILLLLICGLTVLAVMLFSMIFSSGKDWNEFYGYKGGKDGDI